MLIRRLTCYGAGLATASARSFTARCRIRDEALLSHSGSFICIQSRHTRLLHTRLVHTSAFCASSTSKTKKILSSEQARLFVSELDEMERTRLQQALKELTAEGQGEEESLIEGTHWCSHGNWKGLSEPPFFYRKYLIVYKACPQLSL